MITVRYEGGAEHTLVCEGHADGEYGQNIVCAAVSILVATLCEVVEEEAVENASGYTEVVCPINEKNNAAVDFALVGLGMLAEEYPHEIRIED